MRPEKYLHIRAWGEQLLSYEYYIKGEQERAARDKAPRTAIYFSQTENRWIKYGEIHSADTKARIRKKVEALERVYV